MLGEYGKFHLKTICPCNAAGGAVNSCSLPARREQCGSIYLYELNKLFGSQNIMFCTASGIGFLSTGLSPARGSRIRRQRRQRIQTALPILQTHKLDPAFIIKKNPVKHALVNPQAVFCLLHQQ